jgi:hypothetical protein
MLRFCATIHASNDPKRIKRNLLDIFFMARLLDESFNGNISSSKVSLALEYVITHEDNFVVVGIDLKDWKMKWSLKQF